MAFKFVILATCVVYASAGLIPYHSAPAQLSYHAAPATVSYHAAPATVSYHSATPATVSYHSAAPTPLLYHAPLAKAVVTKEVEDYDHHPKYSYAYDVHDSHTGDIKSQQESRDGDVVHGSYSLIEADGSRRVVEYTADSVHGFNAVVHKEPTQHIVKAVHAAPVVHAPLAYYHH